MLIDFDEKTEILKRALKGQASRNEIADLMNTYAIGEQQPGEKIQKAEARFLATPEGARLYSLYESAPLEAPAAVAEKAAEVPISKADQQLHDMALKLVADSKDKLSYHQAYKIAAQQHPDLFQQAVA